MSDLYNLVIPGGGQTNGSRVCPSFFPNVKTPTSFFCPLLKTRFCVHPHPLSGASPVCEESSEVPAYSSEAVTAGTPGAPGEVSSASVDLNTSNLSKYPLTCPFLISTVLTSAYKSTFLQRLGQTWNLSACSALVAPLPFIHFSFTLSWAVAPCLPPPQLARQTSVTFLLLPPTLPFNLCDAKPNKHTPTGCNFCHIRALSFLQHHVQWHDFSVNNQCV